MRTLSRILSFILVIAVLVAFGLFMAPRIRQRIRQLESYFPQILATELAQYLGRSVKIGAIHWQGSYRKRHVIELDHLRLGSAAGERAPFLATIDRAVIHYNPSFLSLRMFQPLSAIDGIDIYHPFIYVVHGPNGQWNVSHILKPSKPRKKPRLPLTTTIHFTGGEVVFLDYKPPHSSGLFGARVVSLAGTALLEQDGPVRVTASGRGAPISAGVPPVAADVSIAGTVDIVTKRMAIHATASHVTVPPILDSYFALNFATIQGGIASGAADLDLGPATPGQKLPFRYSIQGSFTGLSATVQRLSRPITGGSGTLSMAGQSILFRIDRAAYGPAVISGQGTLAGFRPARVDGVFEARGVTQALIAPLVSPKLLSAFHLLGPASATLRVQGKVAGPDVSGTLSAPDVVVQGFPIHNGSLDFIYSDHNVQLSHGSFDVGGGTASLSGGISLTPSGAIYRFSGYANNVNVGSLPLPASIAKLKPTGLVTANFTVTGAGRTFAASAEFTARRAGAIVNGSPATIGSATGALNLNSQAGGGASLSTRLSAKNLLLTLRGQPYSAAGASLILNAQLANGRLTSFTTQGGLVSLASRTLSVRSATWDIKPAGGGLNSVDILISDPDGDLQILGTAASDFSKLNLQVLARNIDLSDVGQVTPALKSAQGTAFIHGTLTGSLKQPHFAAEVQLLGVAFGGIPLNRVYGGLTVTPSRITLSKFIAYLVPGKITLNGSIALSNYRPVAVDLNVQAAGISLSKVADLLSRTTGAKPAFTGVGSGVISVRGPITGPLIDGTLTVDHGSIRGYPVTSATTHFTYQPNLLRFEATHNWSDLLAGLTINSVTAASPIGNIALNAGEIGPNGRLNLRLTASNLAFQELGLPPSVVPLQNATVHVAVTGTLSQPEVVVQVDPVQVAINGLPFTFAASDLALRPVLSAFSVPIQPGSLPLSSLSIGKITISRPATAEMVTLSGSVLPLLNASLKMDGVTLPTAAALALAVAPHAKIAVPAGVTGTIAAATLTIRGRIRQPLPMNTLQAGQPIQKMLSGMVDGLTGGLTVQLKNLAIAPSAVSAANSSSAGATPLPPPSYLTVLGVQLGDPRYRAWEKMITAAAPEASSPAAAKPAEGTLQFATGVLDASLVGTRITLNQLYLREFVNPSTPGISIRVTPGSYVELGGNISVIAEAPGIPVAALSPWTGALGHSLSGTIFITLRASGETSSPVIQASLDAATEKSPLAFGKVTLSVGRLLLTAREGAIAGNLTVGVNGHVATADGSVAFTWKKSPYIFPDSKVMVNASLDNDSLALLHDVSPDFVTAASGPLSVRLAISGTVAHRQFFGQLIAGTPANPGSISLAEVQKPIRNLTIQIDFNGFRANVTRFSGTTDHGAFNMAGYLDLLSKKVDLTFNAQDLHVTDGGLLADFLLRNSKTPSERRADFEHVYGYLTAHITIAGAELTPAIAGTAQLNQADIRLQGSPFGAGKSAGPSTFDPTLNVAFALGAKSVISLQKSGLTLLQLRPTVATFQIGGSLSDIAMDATFRAGNGGGYFNYVIGYWRITEADGHLRYSPSNDPQETGLSFDLHAVLTTQVAESTSPTGATSSAFFAPSGQNLNVRMEVEGSGSITTELKIAGPGIHLYLSSEPPRSQSQLEALLLHTQSLYGIVQGNAQEALPGLFSDVLRQTVLGSVLTPYEMQLAQNLGLEELNLEYQFGGPVFLEVSKHLVDGISARLRRAITNGSADTSLYFDYRLRGSFTFSYGILQNLGIPEQSFTLQTFLRF
ncbi:MAG TPA: translocation/assembly module TamB domain-containing protein [Armatimonadota bacterium]|nr:translocation/assembly module TamB domain-containing protein [Armatimonadota bacterium]